MVKSTWVHHTFCPLWVWGTRQSIVVFPKTSKQSTKLSLPGLSRYNEICAVWNNSWWMPGMAPFGHFTSYSLGHKHFSKLAYSKCSVLKKSACNQTWHYQNTTNTSRTKQHYCCSFSLTQTWHRQPHFPHRFNEKSSCRSDEAIRQTTNR